MYGEYPYSEPIKSSFYKSTLSLLFGIGIIVVWLNWICPLKKTSKNIAKHIDGDPEDDASIVFKALNDALKEFEIKLSIKK